MRFEPGPIPMLAPDLSQLTPGPPEFTDLTTSALADLAGVESDMDAVITALAAFDVPAEFDVIDLSTSTMDQALNELSTFSTGVYLDNADAAIATATDQFQQVAGDAPAEIWEPVPAPQGSTGVGGPMPGVNGPTTLTVDNATRPGDTNFYTGDQFHVHVQIQSGGGNFDFANKALKLSRTKDGLAQPELDIGGTNDFGVLDYVGTWGPNDAGQWVLGVDPVGYGTNNVVTISVQPGPAPGGGGGAAGPPAVTLENLTSGDATTLHAGDTWRITVTGPGDQPVYLDQIKNGIDQGEVFIGSTDATGNLQVAGTIAAAQIGVYTESFRIGTTPAANQLNFTVLA